MKVLLVKLSSLGDIVHTFPAVSEALSRRPGTVIDWLVDRQYVDLVRLHGGVGTVIANATFHSDPSSGYDIVVDAQGLFRSALSARRWRSPVVGADGRSVREWPAHLLYTRRVFTPRTLHASDVSRLLMGAALEYEVQPLARPSPEAQPRAVPRTSRDVMLLHGTQQRSKDWPFAHWVEVARHIADLGFVPAVTWGDPREKEFCQRLAAAVPPVRIIDRLPIAEIAALISSAALVVTVDTGLGHLADWRAVPTIMLFQASDPLGVGPSRHTSKALWVGEPPKRTRRGDRDRPPRHAVVPPEQVNRAIDDALARGPAQ